MNYYESREPNYGTNAIPIWYVVEQQVTDMHRLVQLRKIIVAIPATLGDAVRLHNTILSPIREALQHTGQIDAVMYFREGTTPFSEEAKRSKK